MLPKKYRANRKDVALAFKEGRFIRSDSFIFRFVLRGNTKKASFIVSKKISKSAVERNLLRRRGYIAFEEFLDTFPVPFIGVFLFKRQEKNILVLKDEIKNILSKIY